MAFRRLPGMAAVVGLQRFGWLLLLLGAGLMALRLWRQTPRPTAAAAEPTDTSTATGPSASSAPSFPFSPSARSAAPTRAQPPWRPSKPHPEPAPAPLPLPHPPRPNAHRSPPRHPPARPTAWGPEVFRLIEWRRFEALVEALFAQAGFTTRSQSHGSDGGVDIWLHSRHQPDGAPVSIVQCKHWSDSKPVGVDKIRELRGVMAAHQIRRGQFACTARYTDAAREFARDNQINLLDGTALLDLIAKRTPPQQQALLDVALEGEYWKPTCVNCGVKMVFRLPRNEGK
ncbi:MAG: restriction endonuclease, partial [Burkholderiales bacterium]|nr:restriction endonuclease [Burkholderiales bacterium]